jgi:hypothetical protein
VSAAALTGHCLCGGVRFEITVPLATASYCHCTRCQRRTERLAAVRLGAIDGDPGVRPSRRHHTATAAVWEPLPDDGLPAD